MTLREGQETHMPTGGGLGYQAFELRGLIEIEGSSADIFSLGGSYNHNGQCG
jgi:hypothetical protein